MIGDSTFPFVNVLGCVLNETLLSFPSTWIWSFGIPISVCVVLFNERLGLCHSSSKMQFLNFDGVLSSLSELVGITLLFK